MREIRTHEFGICDICCECKKTLEFEDEACGYGGWYVSFEICKECFIAKLEGESDGGNSIRQEGNS